MSTTEEYSNDWAASLSKQTLEEFMLIGDGHTLFKPEAFTEIGIPENIVADYTHTHHSKKTPKYDAIEKLATAITDLFSEYVEEDEWSPGELVKELVSSEDTRLAEQLSEELLAKMIDNGIDSISGYSPKETIFDKDGNIIESMDAVYGLRLGYGMIDSLGLPRPDKLGRGFQWIAICKSIREYIDSHTADSTEDVQ